jgi:hypothetical protein
MPFFNQPLLKFSINSLPAPHRSSLLSLINSVVAKAMRMTFLFQEPYFLWFSSQTPNTNNDHNAAVFAGSGNPFLNNWLSFSVTKNSFSLEFLSKITDLNNSAVALFCIQCLLGMEKPCFVRRTNSAGNSLSKHFF